MVKYVFGNIAICNYDVVLCLAVIYCFNEKESRTKLPLHLPLTELKKSIILFFCKV